MARRDKKEGRLGDLWAFRSYLAPYHRKLVLASLLMLFGAAGSIYFPYATRIAIDRYITPGKTAGLPVFIILTGVMMLATAAANSWRLRIMARAGQEAVRCIRLDLFSHLQRLPVSYFDHTPVGKVMTRLTSDVDALSELLNGAFIQMGGDSLLLLGYLAVMLLMDWRLALVAMAGLPLLVFVFTYLNKRIRRAEDNVRERTSAINATLQENVSGVKVIQAFWAGDRFAGRFEAANEDLLRAGLRAISIFGFFWPIVDFTWVAGTGLILLYGGYRALEGNLTVGALAAFLGYSSQFFGPLHGLSQEFRVVQRALAGAVRIRGIMQKNVEHREALPEPAAIRGLVEFKGVTFGYDDERPVLRDIEIKALPGQMIALVGRTGAGKTSIINLLCRFYRPQSGSILLDGRDINQMDLDGYRRRIALVLQEPFLFSGTVRENLRYGRPGATDEEMEAVLAVAGLGETHGGHSLDLDTVLHERGGNLSSGQRQLLSLARAILADPSLIILDEATAHVDTTTERKVQAALAHLLAGRTSFVIAHRLSTIQAADQILLIEDGRIVERGDHASLLADGGRYWRLCREQNALTRGEVEEEDDPPEQQSAAEG